MCGSSQSGGVGAAGPLFPLATLFAPLFFVLGYVLDCLATGRPLLTLAEWRYVYYHFNYFDFGFIKRGLAGTVAQALNPGSLETWLPHAILGLGLGVTLFIGYVYSRWERSPALKMLFVISPLLFMNFGYDAGRLDLFLNAVFVLALVLMERGRFAWCGALLLTAPLLHEIFVVVHLPILLLLGWFTVDPSRRISALSWMALPAGAAFALILAWGSYEGDLRQMAGRFDEDWYWQNYRYFMVLKRGLVDNLYYNYGWLSGLGIANPLLFVLPLAFYLPVLLAYHGPDARGRLLALACLVPLGLTVVAADIGRWVSFALFLSFFAYAYLGRQTNERGAAPPAWLGRAAVAFGLLLMCAGPAGHYLAWPLMRALALVFFGIGLPWDGE